MALPIRLNIGCGDKYLPGFVNCDKHPGGDLECEAFPLPFATDYADELWAIHLVEHLPRKLVGKAVDEWYRVLKPGGKLVLELPCLNKIAQLVVDGETNLRLTVLGIFGDPRDEKPDMLHQWCWTTQELQQVLVDQNFRDVQIKEPVFHLPARDMRVEAYKPC